MNNTTMTRLGQNMEHRIYTREEIKAFTESLTIQDVHRYYSAAEADTLTFDSVYRLLHGDDVDPLVKFSDYGQWLMLRSLQSRLTPQQVMMEHKAGFRVLPMWGLLWAGALLLGVWLISDFERKYLPGMPVFYQYLIGVPIFLAVLSSFFLFIPLSKRFAVHLEAQFDRLPLSDRLEAIERWQNRGAEVAVADEPPTAEPPSAGESIRYVSRAGTVSGGFRQRIGERGADLFLRLLPMIFVYAVLLFLLVIFALWYWLH